jgi:mono/diheme cytochrome c family protein
MRALAIAVMAVLALPIATLAQPREPAWAVDPARAGADAPPVGRALFDFVATRDVQGKYVYDLPFPFERLIERLEARAGCAPREQCAKAVLIPLGRSLQRTAAAPDFFKYPRAVVAIDAEPARAGGLFLKDRIYLGYQEQANVVEVISYNETAGRFEFQIVRDYRAGGTPQVIYARRAVCAACHQNLAPIFSQQLWEETNANPRVAERLAEHRAAYYGIPVKRGVDFPAAIDAATDRANRLAVTQRLWREACGADDAAGARCRGAALTAALQYRLSGSRAFDQRGNAWRDHVAATLAREWRARWPNGLALPNADIPNRDPLPFPAGREPRGVTLTHVAAAFEPLLPRVPAEVWTADQSAALHGFVTGLADFVPASDVRALDANLAARAAPPEQRVEAPCEIVRSERWLRFKCVAAGDISPLRLAGRIDVAQGRARGGELDALAVDGAEALTQLDLTQTALDLGQGRLTAVPVAERLRARLADGRRVAGIELRWRAADVRARGDTREASARATARIADDFAPVRVAVDALAEQGAFKGQPFGRAAALAPLFARLGVPLPAGCCVDAAQLPPLAVEPVQKETPAKAYAAFYTQCGVCHATSERFPPNFLAGSSERVSANFKQCAPRIYARLAMWRVAPGARDKTPMPPPLPSVSATVHRPPPGLEALEQSVADLLKGERGAAPELRAMLANGYEELRPCLTSPSPPPLSRQGRGESPALSAPPPLSRQGRGVFVSPSPLAGGGQGEG